MKPDRFEMLSHKKLVGILMAAAYVLLMMGNGFVSLTHPDEVFYVQSAKEMIQHHSWLTPMIFDAPQFEKPVFFFYSGGCYDRPVLRGVSISRVGGSGDRPRRGRFGFCRFDERRSGNPFPS